MKSIGFLHFLRNSPFPDNFILYISGHRTLAYGTVCKNIMRSHGLLEDDKELDECSKDAAVSAIFRNSGAPLRWWQPIHSIMKIPLSTNEYSVCNIIK